MQENHPYISTINKARLFAFLLLLASSVLCLAGTIVILYMAPDLFLYSGTGMGIMIIAFLFTIAMAWIAISNWEKMSLLSRLLSYEGFLLDIVETLNHTKLGEEFVLGLWKDYGGNIIENHLTEIKAPADDIADLYDSKETLFKLYLKIKSKASKAFKAGALNLYRQINQIVEAYEEWFTETWESDTQSNIDFYEEAYASVKHHDEIAERLIRLQIELWEKFRDSEDANYFRAIDIDRLLEILTTVPESALQAWEHINELKDLEGAADSEIEGEIDAAASSARTSGMVTGMMLSNMMNSANRNN